MSTLNESLVVGEFQYGFELEAYVGSIANDSSDKYYQYDEIKDKYSLSNDIKQSLINYFSQWYGKNLQIKIDNSLTSNEAGFEFATPKMNITPLNIKKSIDFLNHLEASPYKIYTDDTCGFHIHFSFPNIDKEDMAWIICNIAFDESLQKLLKFFTDKNGNTFKFFNRKYAKVSFLKDIKNAVLTYNWDKLSSLLSNDKNRLLRIHPENNIEWRGPRNFMDKSNYQTIKDFFVQFNLIIMQIIKIMDKTELNDIDRKSFFKMVKLNNINSTISEEKLQKQIQTIVEKSKSNPLLLAQINNNVKADWNQIIWELNNETNGNYLNMLRYQKFKNKNILKAILTYNPEFKKYIIN